MTHRTAHDIGSAWETGAYSIALGIGGIMEDARQARIADRAEAQAIRAQTARLRARRVAIEQAAAREAEAQERSAVYRAALYRAELARRARAAA